MLIELDPVDRITADAVGEPGSRTFFIQARKGDHLVTVLVEKQQVQLLSASVVEILSRVERDTGEGAPEESMGLEEPIVPEWRAGRLSIGYQDERDLLLLEAEELIPGQEDEEDDEAEEEEDGDEEPGSEDEDALESLEARTGFDAETLAELARIEAAAVPSDPTDPSAPEPGRVRFWASREQMLALARHGAAVCASGRPPCQFCNNPLDPEGHVCPAMNGHRNLSDT